MPEDGGDPCEAGASEETEKCKRQCHKPVFCEWGKWQNEGECSVTCGTGVVKRVRYLQMTNKPTGQINLVEEYEDLAQKQKVVADSHVRDIVISFASGGLLSFVALMVAMFVLRTRHSGQGESRILQAGHGESHVEPLTGIE